MTSPGTPEGSDTAARVTLRPFAATDADYARYVEIGNANDPEHARTVEDMRHDDDTWDAARYDKLRLMAEDEAGRVVGCGQIAHIETAFHPQKYWLDVHVDPPFQGRGYGSAIYDRLLAELRQRHATAVRTATKESRSHVVGFLLRRGFVEVERIWESTLDVNAFDLDAFAAAEPRALAQGITFTTLGEEMARDPDAVRTAYALHVAVRRDVPSLDPYTAPPFDDWARGTLGSPGLLPEGYLLARHGDRYVGQSALWKSSVSPDVLGQGLTGVLREYRGQGIAIALKVRGVRLAKARGAREIRTGNDARNLPMLRLNEALGFRWLLAWLTFEQRRLRRLAHDTL